MKDKSQIILEAEESFARRVALGVIVKKPLTAWHLMLPGMFVFDFLKRSSETKRYGELFLFPRKLALRGALEVLKGDDKKKVLSQTEGDIKQWLISLKLFSERVLRGHMEQIHLLIDHYLMLLQATGNSYPELVRNAYETRNRYQDYLQKVTTAEQEVDSAVAEISGSTPEVWERLRAEEAQVAEMRKKEMHRIF